MMFGALAVVAVLAGSAVAELSECGGKPADVFFVLDSSGSISVGNFEKELQFTQEVTSNFDMGPGKVQVGALSFSKTVSPKFGLGEYYNKVHAMDKLATIQYEGYGTNTGAALKYLHEQGLPVSRIREDTPRIAIILTDGQSQNSKSTLREAELVHQAGIIVFAIGIGNQVDRDELKAMASEPSSKFVFMVDDFDALQNIKDILSSRACEVKPITPVSKIQAEVEEEVRRYGRCTPRNSLDLVFAVDTAAIGATNAKFVFTFVGNLSDHLNMDASSTNIATIGNGCSGGTIVEQSQSDPNSVKAGLASYKAPVFETMMRNMRLKALDGRRSSKHIGVVFLGDRLSPYNYRNAVLERKRATFQKTAIFVVGVGNRVDETQAGNLTANDGQYYHVMDFDSMNQVEPLLLSRLCMFGVKDE